MKKVIALLLGLLMIASLAACGQKTEAPASPSSPAAPASNPSAPAASNPSAPASNPSAPASNPSAPASSKRVVLNCAATYDYGTQDYVAQSPWGYGGTVNVMEPLWDLGTDGTYKMVLADSYEWEADDHMVVHLKKGIKFSNGNPLTADDVLFSLERNRDCGTAYGPQHVQTTDFERTKVRDDYTLDWYLLQPTIIHMSVAVSVFIYDKESYDEKVQAERPIGTGPYVVTDYVVNSHLTIERRDDYWGELPEIETATFRMLAEPSQRVNSLETGLVDYAPVPMNDVDFVSSLPNVTVVPRGGNWIYLGFNISQDGKLADPTARDAICHAIDRQAISDIVYQGKARVMQNPFTPALYDYDPRWDGLGAYKEGYNLDLAKKMADESGLTGKTLLLANNGTADLVQISEMIQSMLTKIGVNCEIVAYDSASYSQVKNDKTKFDICVSSGVSGNKVSGDSFVNAITRNKIYQIHENWPPEHAERYFSIIAGTLSNMNEAERKELCYECMQYYVECNPTFGLVEYDTFNAYPADLDLENYTLRATNQPYALGMHFK